MTPQEAHNQTFAELVGWAVTTAQRTNVVFRGKDGLPVQVAENSDIMRYLMDKYQRVTQPDLVNDLQALGMLANGPEAGATQGSAVATPVTTAPPPVAQVPGTVPQPQGPGVPTSTIPLPPFPYPVFRTANNHLALQDGRLLCQQCVKDGKPNLYITKTPRDLKGLGAHGRLHVDKTPPGYDLSGLPLLPDTVVAPGVTPPSVPAAPVPQVAQTPVPQHNTIETPGPVTTPDVAAAASAIESLMGHRTLEKTQDPTASPQLPAMGPEAVQFLALKIQEAEQSVIHEIRRIEWDLTVYVLGIITLPDDVKAQLYREFAAPRMPKLVELLRSA